MIMTAYTDSVSVMSIEKRNPIAAAIPVLLPASPPQVLRRSFISSKTVKGLDKYRRLSLLPYPAHHFQGTICPPGKHRIFYTALPHLLSLSQDIPNSTRSSP